MGCVFLLFSLVVFSAVRIASVIEKMVWEDVSAVSQDFLLLPAGRKNQ